MKVADLILEGKHVLQGVKANAKRHGRKTQPDRSDGAKAATGLDESMNLNAIRTFQESSAKPTAVLNLNPAPWRIN